MYGDEVIYGGGKTLRDGMGLANTMSSNEGSLDIVITNVTIIDAIIGVVKADVGIKDGKIAGIGKAGNPNVMDGVHPDLLKVTSIADIPDGILHEKCSRQVDGRLYRK